MDLSEVSVDIVAEADEARFRALMQACRATSARASCHRSPGAPSMTGRPATDRAAPPAAARRPLAPRPRGQRLEAQPMRARHQFLDATVPGQAMRGVPSGGVPVLMQRMNIVGGPSPATTGRKRRSPGNGTTNGHCIQQQIDLIELWDSRALEKHQMLLKRSEY